MEASSPKHQLASDVIYNPSVILSTQVISEVCFNLRRKADYTETEIRQTLDNFKKNYAVCIITVDVIYLASKLREDSLISYWDSLIIASAIHAECTVLYSEDMNHSQRIGGLVIINPFF
jgi:predicted nucleic acid-binding protein